MGPRRFLFPLFCSYLPDFLATSQTNAMYVANYGVENGADCNLSSTDSVASLNLSQNTVGTIAYLPPGSHPVAMAETPNGQGLYVANQGNNTVVDLSPIDLSTMATISVDSPPVWMVARGDNQRFTLLLRETVRSFRENWSPLMQRPIRFFRAKRIFRSAWAPISFCTIQVSTGST